MNIQNLVAMTKGQATSPIFQTDNKAAVTTLKDGDEVGTETTVSDTEAAAAEEFSTFLTLLTAQIRNQDPLAPLDSTQFVEQLATFSQVEMQAKSNAHLENIATMLAQNLYQTNTSPSTDDA